MALTPQIRASEGNVLSAYNASGNINASEANTLLVYNIPTDSLRASEANISVVFRQVAQEVRIPEANVLAVAAGRVDNVKLRAWTYTLDGHDFYVLKLGTEGKTLVLDLMTKQWSWWTNGEEGTFRLSVGMNWRSSGGVPSNFGSNIVVGDDSYGVLWVLNPEQGTDDGLLNDTDLTFPRVATGQIPSKSRQTIPIYSVDLSASFGSPALAGNSVTLEYSDDQGKTYVTADAPQVSLEGGYDQQFIWRSLGQVRSPGRLFRITDNGAFARLNSLNVNE